MVGVLSRVFGDLQGHARRQDCQVLDRAIDDVRGLAYSWMENIGALDVRKYGAGVR